MTVHSIRLYQVFDAPVEEVWEVFSDHARFGQLMGMPMVRIVDSTDHDHVNGVGSVRLIKLSFAPFEETIRKWDRLRCIEYQITKGSPLHHHFGSMKFERLSSTQCSLDYSIELGSRIPLLGVILRWILQRAIARGLRRYADSLL